MNNKKLIIFITSMVLIVAIATSATLAYVTAKTSKVTNTFVVGGGIQITLDEGKVDANGKFINQTTNRGDANQYTLVPGKTYDKDPTVTVIANSMDCYIYVAIKNDLAGAETTDETTNKKIATQMSEKGWVEQTTDSGYTIYRYPTKVVKSASDQPFVLFDNITIDGSTDVSAYSNKTIVIYAVAIQAETFSDASDAWTKANDAGDLTEFLGQLS